MSKLLLGAIASLFLFQAVRAQPVLPQTTLTINQKTITAEVADTKVTRERGLMHRTRMEADAGMLFVFDRPQPVCMWMKNTLIPLSVAFIDSYGRIINIEKMQPQTQSLHCSRQDARYALEMNLGWFERNGASAFEQVHGLPVPKQ